MPGWVYRRGARRAAVEHGAGSDADIDPLRPQPLDPTMIQRIASHFRLLASRARANSTDDELDEWRHAVSWLDGVALSLESHTEWEKCGRRWAYKMNHMLTALMLASKLKDKSA
eukprot:635048-Pyramimonas_sp.AAC.1